MEQAHGSAPTTRRHLLALAGGATIALRAAPAWGAEAAHIGFISGFRSLRAGR
jgi:hypothetical protein